MSVFSELRRRGGVPKWQQLAVAVGALLLGSCSRYDAKLLDGAVRDRDGGVQLLDPVDGGGDVQHYPDAATFACRPNPTPTEGCPEICPETCNGADDDCDDRVDESDMADGVQCEAACTKRTIAGHTYYFCGQSASWQAARSKCIEELHADLARVIDGTQGQLLSEQSTAPAWIGGHVLHDELWAWADNRVPFWQGDASGAPVFGRYANWVDGKPSTGESCGDLREQGGFGSDDCAQEKPFLCEVSLDACPKDPNKTDPGQCGCAIADLDQDSDGLAACNDACDDDAHKPLPMPCGCSVGAGDRDGDGVGDCNDACPDDKHKTAAGACGCGQPDADTDHDGVADCNDDCAEDVAKLVPGQCGCGIADGDRDMDGTVDCKDGCPGDATTVGDCFKFTASNIDPRRVEFGSAPNATLNCGTTTVDTGSTGVKFTNWCGSAPTWTVQHQTGGPDLVVIGLRGLTVAANNTLRLVGGRPIVFAVRGDVNIAGAIDASANAALAGAGGNAQCDASSGGPGLVSSSRGGGGGGGGFRTAGGMGGETHTSGTAGSAGVARGNATLVPLLGGCAGGTAGGCTGSAAAGGGAVQITASGTIKLTGAIRASGGTGADGCNSGGGQGGGSGGAILLESAGTTASSSNIVVNGGSGGDGDGLGGNGGNGSTGVSAAGGSGDSSSSGGSGGGGYGRVVIH